MYVIIDNEDGAIIDENLNEFEATLYLGDDTITIKEQEEV